MSEAERWKGQHFIHDQEKVWNLFKIDKILGRSHEFRTSTSSVLELVSVPGILLVTCTILVLVQYTIPITSICCGPVMVPGRVPIHHSYHQYLLWSCDGTEEGTHT